MKLKDGYHILEKLQKLGFIRNSDNIESIKQKLSEKLDSEKIKVLIIEDHQLIIEAYAITFGMTSKSLPHYNFELETATSCKEAILKLKTHTGYDLVILDIRLPPYPEENIYSGEDIAHWMDKNLNPKPKIIINTFFNDDYRLYNLYKNIDPDGFLTKDEASTASISEAIETVLESPPYYSKLILNMIRKNFSKPALLDDIDRKLIYLLSMGASTKNLTDELAYSKTSVEKRKKRIIEMLGVEGNDLRSLITTAKEKGFI